MTRAWAAALLAASLAVGSAQAQVFAGFERVDSPGSIRAEQPSIVALSDGRALLTWTELSEPFRATVKTALFDGTGWSVPVAVTTGDDLFVNYADFPSAVGLDDGTLAVHWLRIIGASPYAYGIEIALSSDDGATWGEPIVPHRDDSPREHGFVSLLADGPESALVMWLDGRNYDSSEPGAPTNAMQLRSTTLGSDAALGDDIKLDARTCTCCQTSATRTGDGTILLAYRDRTIEETRDISVVRRVDGHWSAPVPVSKDGWEIAGCPVNGPAIDAKGERAALAWYTEAARTPTVKLSFSNDNGATFDTPHLIDLGDPSGRVDLILLDDGSALVSWVELTDGGETLLVCRATAQDGCGEAQEITISASGPSIGFPRMDLVAETVFLAWTEPTRSGDGRANGGSRIGIARGSLLGISANQ